MGKSSGWQHRKASSDKERFGLLDSPKMVRYRTQPIFQDPKGELPDLRPFTALGVTSGIGSMLVGASQNGFKVVGNLEWRDYYRYQNKDGDSTFVNNFPGAFMARGLDDVPPNMLPGSIDFIAGHPECGRYSMLSHSVTLGNYKDSRGTDVSDIPMFLTLIAELRPRFFLMDDLPASFGPFPMDKYVDLLPEYDLFPEWISNYGYGNIQKYRNRMFIVGALKSERFTFQPGEEWHDLNLRDVIGHLVDTPAGSIPNHAFVDPDFIPGRYVNMRFYGDRCNWGELSELFKEENRAKNLKYFTPSGEEKARPGTNNPKWDGFCPVLSGGYNPLHPINRRPLTIRERAEIQGFPSDFLFHYEDEDVYSPVWEPYNSNGQRGIKQTGKAMPLQFCTYVAEQIKAHMSGNAFICSGERSLKPNPMVTQAKVDFCKRGGYEDQETACSNCWNASKCELLTPSERTKYAKTNT